MTDKAPRPAQNSIMRHVYDTIDSLGGGTFEQIQEYLPATMEDPQPNNKQLLGCLQNSVYRGHLIEDSTHQPGITYYRIASKDYYDIRRAKTVKLYRTNLARAKSKARYRQAHPKAAEVQPKSNGVVAALDREIKLLAADERMIHNKIDRLTKVRVKLVNLGM